MFPPLIVFSPPAAAAVYVSYFALEKDLDVEILWLCSCLSWVMLDVFVLAPMYVFYADILSLRSMHW